MPEQQQRERGKTARGACRARWIVAAVAMALLAIGCGTSAPTISECLAEVETLEAVWERFEDNMPDSLAEEFVRALEEPETLADLERIGAEVERIGSVIERMEAESERLSADERRALEDLKAEGERLGFEFARTMSKAIKGNPLLTDVDQLLDESIELAERCDHVPAAFFPQ